MKLVSALSLLLLFSCILFVAGCVATSGITSAHASIAPEVTLANKATYAWYQEKPKALQDMEGSYTPVLDKNVRKAIENELQEKGLKKVTSNPDLLLAYDVSVTVPVEKDKPELYATGFGYSYAYEVGYRYKYGTSKIEGFRPVDLFKQGTLIIDLIDPLSGQLIWRGWTEGAISNFDADYRKVKGQVEAILEKLPQH